MKRINYFGRFENKSADAEDRRTRAFLVLVRLDPPVQAAFIDAIREKQREQGAGSLVLARTATDTGVGGVWSQVGTLRTDEADTPHASPRPLSPAEMSGPIQRERSVPASPVKTGKHRFATKVNRYDRGR